LLFKKLLHQKYKLEFALPKLDEIKTDGDIRACLRKYGGHGWHASGTCRMGVNDDAVVCPRLKVKGVKGLRVADASIFPEVTSGNTNWPCLMVGSKAAELILEDYSLM